MSGPLDDAMRLLASEKEHQDERLRQDREREQNADQELQRLVTDFLARMARAGNPGMDWEVKDGFFKKVRGWSLTYESSDSWLRIPVRVDGLVPAKDSTTYVRPEVSKRNLRPGQIRLLARSMAEIMRRHGVS